MEYKVLDMDDALLTAAPGQLFLLLERDDQAERVG